MVRREDKDEPWRESFDGGAVWIPRRWPSALAYLPVVVAVALFYLMIVLVVFRVEGRLALAAVVLGLTAVAVALAWLAEVIGRRCVVITAEAVSVRVRHAVLFKTAWEDVQRVELQAGEPVWNLLGAFASGSIGFPSILVASRSGDFVRLPRLLAPLGSDIVRLSDLLESACREKGVRYSAELE